MAQVALIPTSYKTGRYFGMTVKIAKLERVFLFNGVKLPDPSPDFTVEQVRDTYVNTYPELATAAIEGPSPIDGTMQYTFTRAVGAKG
jgi:PRTRC genetic system protein C